MSGKAAATIFARFCAAFGDSEHPDPERVSAADDEALRGVGLSRQKAGYLRNLAEQWDAGNMPDRDQLAAMDHAAAIEALTAFKGIGVWTAQMVLIF